MLLCGTMLFYVATSNDRPAGFFAPISTWTLGLLLTMFVSGVAAGLALAVSRVIDSWQGNLRPWFAVLGVVSLWLAAGAYVGLGLWKQSFSFTLSRSVTAIAGLTAAFALATTASSEINPLQTLLWGGNVIFVGFLAGWSISDAFR